MNIIYMGTPEFAVSPLKRLIEDGHNISAVVTQPDRPVGRKKVLSAPPLKVFAKSCGIDVLQFEKIRDNAHVLKNYDADIMVTCAYGQILTQEIIDICPHGIINIHASLLPKYRGASPIASAILAGETLTGVTIMQTEKGLDTGDILYVETLDIKDGETCKELTERLSQTGAQAVSEAIRLIEQGKIKRIKQDDSKASIVKTIKKQDALIDFNKSAIQIYNQIRAFNPWPVAYAFLGADTLKFYRAQLTEDKTCGAGVVAAADKVNGLLIGASDYLLKITEIQPAGGRVMTAKEYIAGGKIKAGDKLN